MSAYTLIAVAVRYGQYTRACSAARGKSGTYNGSQRLTGTFSGGHYKIGVCVRFSPTGFSESEAMY